MNRIDQLLKILADQPDDCFVLHALGLEYVKLGDYPKAQAYFEQVLKIDEMYVGTYYHLAKLLEMLDKKTEAEDVYTKGIHVASKLNDRHSQNELQMAKDDME